MAKISPKPKTLSSERLLFCMLVVSLSFAGPGVAAPDEAHVVQDIASSTLSTWFRPGSIQSKERAEQVLSEAGRERAEIAAKFAVSERACEGQFFANSCIENARERQRHDLAAVRKIEVEANALLRRLRIEERDRAVAEKRAGQEKSEAERARESTPPTSSSATPDGVSGQEGMTITPASGVSDRQARHEAKLRRIEERERANAQKRADKAAAYEKKTMETQRRQLAAETKAVKEGSR
ncbi:MAG: hypothetical protein JWQ00_2601 [Noviherbaspirillum sp.]|nr:hypothetical protein [Noviherbaspirillum sp.]